MLYLPPLLSVKIKQITCSFSPRLPPSAPPPSSWRVTQNDKPVQVFRSSQMESRKVWYKSAPSLLLRRVPQCFDSTMVLTRIYTCRYIPWRYGFRYIVMCILEGFFHQQREQSAQLPCLLGQRGTWRDCRAHLVQPPSLGC